MANNWDVLKMLSEKDRDIQAFNISTNLIAVKAGKNGWGRVEIAIDNNTVGRIIKGSLEGRKNNIAGLFLTYGTEDFKKTEEELDNAN